MVAVKINLLPFLKIPLNEKLFGKNKTWRGIILMCLFSIPGVLLAQKLDNSLGFSDANLFLLSIGLGLGYTLSELPNSFFKRRLNIAEGKTSDKHKWLQIIIDQGDSAVGTAIAYKLFLGATWPLLLTFGLLGILIHLLINILLYLVKLRKEPF